MEATRLRVLAAPRKRAFHRKRLTRGVLLFSPFREAESMQSPFSRDTVCRVFVIVTGHAVIRLKGKKMLGGSSPQVGPWPRMDTFYVKL